MPIPHFSSLLRYKHLAGPVPDLLFPSASWEIKIKMAGMVLQEDQLNSEYAELASLFSAIKCNLNLCTMKVVAKSGLAENGLVLSGL